MTESAIDRSQLQEGMSVLGSDGEMIGRLREVREASIVVDRTAGAALHVPLQFVRYTAGNGVILTVASSKAVEMHWETAAR